MLYLAEVQKQKGGLLGGGGKTELKLLACQRTDQSWSTVSEEVIGTEEASKLNDGVLILVELNPNRQVQRIQEAGRPLVNILQNFSRQLEKFKVKEEEINQWKQSLTFQAQELNHREMDMEARLEQLQNMEDEFQNLEAQKQEVETSRTGIERLQEEIERKRQELEGAWEHLRGEQRLLEEFKAEYQQKAGLDEQQSRVLSELLDSLSNSVAPTEIVQEHLNLAFEIVKSQQVLLEPYSQQLQQQKTTVNEQQLEVDRLSKLLVESQNEWQKAQNSLEQQTSQLKLNTADFNSKQEYVRMLKEQLHYQQKLSEQIRSSGAIGNRVKTQPVDVNALEKMSVEELQKLVQDLQEKLGIDSSFVNDQELELTFKQKTIEELQKKIQQASELDLNSLEAELVDEKDLSRMLNETLVGQRRNLLEREEFIKQHQVVLSWRQGNSLVFGLEEQTIDLKPILLQIETYQQQYSEQIENLEVEMGQILASIEQTQLILEKETQEQQMKRQELLSIEQHLLSLQTTTAESWGRVHLYQEVLQPMQDGLKGLQQKLLGIAEALAQVQVTGDYQLQAVTQMRQTILSLIE
ncbi:MAG: pilus motility taxis protein HmpF [Rhizonema sp. NSF051]|nr:pilus motility taxis protein HmpF [Rhizonema sp. NSF051]